MLIQILLGQTTIQILLEILAIYYDSCKKISEGGAQNFKINR